jgi:hypothetical protein
LSSSLDSDDNKEKELKKVRKACNKLVFIMKCMLKKKSVSAENLKQLHATVGEVKKEFKDGFCSFDKQKLWNQNICYQREAIIICMRKCSRLKCLFLRKGT